MIIKYNSIRYKLIVLKCKLFGWFIPELRGEKEPADYEDLANF